MMRRVYMRRDRYRDGSITMERNGDMCISHPEDGGRPSYILNVWDGWGGDGATIANWSLLFDSVNSRRSLDCWDLQRDRKNSRDCPCACGSYRSRNVCGIGLQTMC